MLHDISTEIKLGGRITVEEQLSCTFGLGRFLEKDTKF
ncbi:hypothetical protein X474_08915 [Dethiosulfatarculus sandiegensis]|uniref:Uncharacterized protein n=1 Tax=Dethiosulfatarculus sandiegensis TaxID=1429043 RepID=A0A0D2GHH7_9BACT|nr:hypothetical protein X474_08915 [Dethiosulfatarculus sandiegensis]